MNLKDRALNFASWLLAVILPFSCTGCLGYRLGSTNPEAAGMRVGVLPFENQTYEPGLSEEVTAAIRHRLQLDGSLRISRPSSADIQLRGVILDYQRRGLTYDPMDVRVPRDYELRMRAHVVAIRTADQKVIFDREVTARAAVRVAGDQPTAEQQVLPILADDLARQVVSLLVDGSW